MKTWFKAVRPDLSSFHDRHFVYRVGGTHRPRTSRPETFVTAGSNGFEMCTDLVLHASPSPPDATRFNTRWPWRILEVTGKPVVEDGTKAGFRQLKVIREVPVEESFGPNGSDVLAIVRRCESLTSDELARLAAAWDAARAAAWDAAWDAARAAAWAAARDAARAAAWAAAWAAARDAAWDAARAASVADLVGQHGLKQHHIDTLMAPWLSVIGPS